MTQEPVIPEFEGRRVDVLAIQLSGSPEDGGVGRELHQDQHLTVVARIKVKKVEFETKKGVTIRTHKATVEELYEVPGSVLAHAHMTITGQGALDLGGDGGREG